jgi:hypothetical protein
MIKWKTVNRFPTFEEADTKRNQLIKEGKRVKVKKYGGKLDKPIRFEVKVAQTDS